MPFGWPIHLPTLLGSRSNDGNAPGLSETMIRSPTRRIQNSPKRLFRDRVRTEFLNGPPALNGGDYRRVRND